MLVFHVYFINNMILHVSVRGQSLVAVVARWRWDILRCYGVNTIGRTQAKKQNYAISCLTRKNFTSRARTPAEGWWQNCGQVEGRAGAPWCRGGAGGG